MHQGPNCTPAPPGQEIDGSSDQSLRPLLYNGWVFPLFMANFFVMVLANIRRRNASGIGMLILWTEYQLAKLIAPYALNNISICNDGALCQRQQLSAFWSTFLLHHLGGPDNFSVFSLEENELSWAGMISIGLDIFGSGYVLLYKNVRGDTALFSASIIIFIVGAAKNMERARALFGTDFGIIWNSSKKKQPSQIFSTDGDGSVSLDDEEALMVAHDMLPVCKRAMSDSSVENVSPDNDHDLNTSREIFNLGWQDMCSVVEMELSLMYDILYTKAAVAHTWIGYIIRVASPVAVAAATILFWLFYSKEGQTIEDVLVTYALLAATFVWDTRWLFRALGSTWAHTFLRSSWSWLHHWALCTGRWRRFRHVIVSLELLLTAPSSSPSSYRRWSGTVEQYSLMRECTEHKSSFSACNGILAKKFGLEDVWNEFRHLKGHKASDDVKRAVFTRVRKLLKLTITYEKPDKDAYSMKDITTSWGQLTAKRRHENLVSLHLGFGHEFQEDILVWHIATQVFLICSDRARSVIRNDKNAASQATAIKVLSEYLMFLVAVRGHMLPGLALRGLYEVTLKYLRQVDKDGSSSSLFTTREEKLARMLIDRKKTDKRWGFDRHEETRTVRDGANLAVELLDEAHESEMPLLLDLIFNVWVDKLLYAATQCSPESHAKQLGRGGGLTTIVWIMAQHAGLYQIGVNGPDAISDDEMQPDEKKRKEPGEMEAEQDSPPRMSSYPEPGEEEYPPSWPESIVGPPYFGGHKPRMDPRPQVLDEPQEIKPRKPRRERHRRYATLYPVD